MELKSRLTKLKNRSKAQYKKLRILPSKLPSSPAAGLVKAAARPLKAGGPSEEASKRGKTSGRGEELGGRKAPEGGEASKEGEELGRGKAPEGGEASRGGEEEGKRLREGRYWEKGRC